MLESIISFGTTGLGASTETIRANMYTGIEWWESLIKLHPHVAEEMPDFALWMQDTESVKRWVKHFYLKNR